MKIKDCACHFLIKITPVHYTAFSKLIPWLTVCVTHVWTFCWTEMWLIVFCFIWRDSLSATKRRMWDVILGCWLWEVRGFLWKVLGWDQRRVVKRDQAKGDRRDEDLISTYNLRSQIVKGSFDSPFITCKASP